MQKRSYARTIYCIHPDHGLPPSSHPLIESQFRRTIPTMCVSDLMQARPQHLHKILLIDFKQYAEILEQIAQLPLNDKNFETILINVNDRLPTGTLIKFGNLKGLFYQSDTMEAVTTGLESIRQGKNWLPRDIASQLLHYYRHMVTSSTTPNAVSLTMREIEILKCLKEGSSNMQIADDLFISEFTVKSHLYHIFKKLSVRNRVQAIAWANQNIAC